MFIPCLVVVLEMLWMLQNGKLVSKLSDWLSKDATYLIEDMNTVTGLRPLFGKLDPIWLCGLPKLAVRLLDPQTIERTLFARVNGQNGEARSLSLSKLCVFRFDLCNQLRMIRQQA